MVDVSGLVAAWLALATAASAQFQYCRFTTQHTLCQHKGIGQHCQQLQERTVGAAEAQYIVAEHNRLRSRVASGREGRGSPFSQPAAANMHQLEWDDELAKVAQRHADQCTFKHDCRDCKRVARFKVGQNLYSSSSTRLDAQADWRRAIYAWYDEVALFDPHNIEPFVFVSPLGHYTQMMWATTSRIGCGYTLYKEGPWWTKLYVCDYGSAGNFQRGQMYQRGAPCSSCPRGTTCSKQYPGLCTEFSSYGAPTNQLVPAKRPVVTSPVTGFTSPNHDGHQLFACDLDHDGCQVKFVGTTWKVIHTDSPQGRILGTAVTSGRTSELTFTSLVVPPREGTLCLALSYMKYQLQGDALVDLVISLEPFGLGERHEHVEQLDARGTMRSVSFQVDHVLQPFTVRLTAAVPAWAFGQATVLAVDNVRVVAGPCGAHSARPTFGHYVRHYYGR